MKAKRKVMVMANIFVILASMLIFASSAIVRTYTYGDTVNNSSKDSLEEKNIGQGHIKIKKEYNNNDILTASWEDEEYQEESSSYNEHDNVASNDDYLYNLKEKYLGSSMN